MHSANTVSAGTSSLQVLQAWTYYVDRRCRMSRQTFWLAVQLEHATRIVARCHVDDQGNKSFHGTVMAERVLRVEALAEALRLNAVEKLVLPPHMHVCSSCTPFEAASASAGLPAQELARSLSRASQAQDLSPTS